MLVQIQTTTLCNGKCIICPYPTSWFAKHPAFMSDELYTKILNDLADYMPFFESKFCPYLLEEPFTDKKILNRIEEAINTLYYPYLEVSTNLIVPNYAQITKLVELYRRNSYHGRIMVSHHGLTKESYEKIMGFPYGKALDNLEHLIRQTEGNLPIWIHTASQSVDGTIIFNTPQEIHDYWTTWLNHNGLPINNITIFPLFFHNRAGNVKLTNWTPPPQSYIGCPRKDDLHVLWDGRVISCCCDYEIEQVIGDLSKQSVKEYFDSLGYKSWVNKLTGIEEPPADFICRRCTKIGA